MKPGKRPVMGVLDRLSCLAFRAMPLRPWSGSSFWVFRFSPALPELRIRCVGFRSSRTFIWSDGRGVRNLFPARLCRSDKHGAIKIRRLGNGGSARLQPLMDADGLARIEAHVDVIAPGDRLVYLPFSQLFG